MKDLRVMWLGDLNSPKFFLKENAEHILDNAKRTPFSKELVIEVLSEASHEYDATEIMK